MDVGNEVIEHSDPELQNLNLDLAKIDRSYTCEIHKYRVRKI